MKTKDTSNNDVKKQQRIFTRVKNNKKKDNI